MDLKDKIMVITGASSGIGMATARRLDRAGVQALICSSSSILSMKSRTNWRCTSVA